MGAQKESEAAEYLTGCGYEILERNYRCHLGEIDLIAKKDGYLVFVEVKYRSSGRFGDPVEAVSFKKQCIISRVAMQYCVSHRISEQTPMRFDVVAMLRDDIFLYVNAFPFHCR